MEGGAIAVFAANLLPIDSHLMHIPLIHVGQELREVDFCVLLPSATLLNHGP
jgi:hypothetical protein